ncbi:inheritance of peroxisomes protein 1-domain-containing protein [Thermothelomyces heterothallicus CBS 202.75]|uniref:inheritance of peroxisomes protein 1-domain-containing protein n=1 Tax=Thermothelomyces heterothallicus CBS 202.75 TaxID=1149848 RepID=UPI003743F756
MESARPKSSGFAAPRRVFTSPLPPSAPQPAGGLVDTLYYHPNVKIVSFTAGTSFLFNCQRTVGGSDIEPGSLPWSSQLERTIAVGPFSIYRAPGSVAFLSCGAALQPILPKSQVWCVDEESSKFVLQIRRPQYWRIEVPVKEQEDVRGAQRLREVFDSILQFEKTECPFKRPFTVELPERPRTPVEKRPWTPARRSSASLPLTPVTPVEIARLHEGTPRGSFCMGDLRAALGTRRVLNEHTKNPEPPAGEVAPAYRDTFGTHGQTNDNSSSVNSGHEKPADVSAVLPPRIPSATSPLPKLSPLSSADKRIEAPRFTPPSESLESIRGRESWLPTPLPPSPPSSTPGSPRNSAQALHMQDSAETANTNHTVPSRSIGSRPSQPWNANTTDSLNVSKCSTPACHPQEPAATAQSTVIPIIKEPETILPSSTPTSLHSESQMRREPTAASSASSDRSCSPSRRSLSPLSPHGNGPTTKHRRQSSPTTMAYNTTARPNRASTTGTTSTQGALAVVRSLPMTVLHKTCEILMSPPSHLISLMLDVAARITAGEWRGLVFGMGEGGERVSVAWDWSDDEGYMGYGRLERDDFWLRDRRNTRPTTGRRLKMAGTFPDSDDEEEEEGIGPLDVPRSLRGTSVSPRKENEEGRSAVADDSAAEAVKSREPGEDKAAKEDAV